MIEEELDKAGLPLELKYMAVIESALQTKAVSRAGAVGMWQFMYGTGKMYKLDISTYVDERKDPLSATKAACQYLSSMYKLYGDWQLAIASYNCGPGNVNKAIRRSGGKKNFWEIYKYLPSETRGYVPAFIAATYLFNYYNEHNLHPAELTLPLATDTVQVKEYVHLHDVASMLKLDENLVEELNPQYRRNIVPGSEKTPKMLVLPSVGAIKFVTQVDTINNLYLARVENRTTTPQIQTTTSTLDLDGYEKIYYTVKSGDNLGYIADWYDTYTSRIKSWNGMRGNTIKVGQKLAIYVPKSKKDFYASINDLSFSEKQSLDGKPKTVAVSRNTTVSASGYIEYTVKSGDSIWAISQRHPGNTVSSILQLNNMSSASCLQPGNVLKLNPNPNN
ncbi:MAG: transglycosylase SLT domain-containing protein, partial [Bacteroidetes bacterium]|nr:transglycosylase SLT domain-containing protein [Bacteroidota bacterium]